MNSGEPMESYSYGRPGDSGDMGGFDVKRVQTANTGVHPAAAQGSLRAFLPYSGLTLS
jgi:hypothetical protein